MRIALITNIPTPYRVPLFNQLKKSLSGHELLVIFGDKTYKRRNFQVGDDFQFEHIYLSSKKLQVGNKEKTLFLYSGLNKALKAFQPDHIISSGFSIATLKSVRYAKRNNVKISVWTGSIADSNESSRRTTYRTWLAKKVSNFVCYGSLAKEYVKSLGVSEENISIAINTVDLDFFSRINKIETAFTSNPKELLVIGYLSPRKGVFQMIQDLSALLDERQDVLIRIIGSGEEEDSISEWIEQKKLGNKVILEGYKQKEELPEYLERAYLVLFPTKRDIWGLVLNETMASGNTCLVSNKAGATYDLLNNERTAIGADFSNKEELVTKLVDLLDHPNKVEKIGKEAKHFIQQKASLEVSVQGFIKAIGL